MLHKLAFYISDPACINVFNVSKQSFLNRCFILFIFLKKNKALKARVSHLTKQTAAGWLFQFVSKHSEAHKAQQNTRPAGNKVQLFISQAAEGWTDAEFSTVPGCSCDSHIHNSTVWKGEPCVEAVSEWVSRCLAATVSSALSRQQPGVVCTDVRWWYEKHVCVQNDRLPYLSVIRCSREQIRRKKKKKIQGTAPSLNSSSGLFAKLIKWWLAIILTLFNFINSNVGSGVCGGVMLNCQKYEFEPEHLCLDNNLELKYQRQLVWQVPVWGKQPRDTSSNGRTLDASFPALSQTTQSHEKQLLPPRVSYRGQQSWASHSKDAVTGGFSRKPLWQTGGQQCRSIESRMEKKNPWRLLNITEPMSDIYKH